VQQKTGSTITKQQKKKRKSL